MNAALLQRLTGELRREIVTRSFTTPSWFPPVLALPVGAGGMHLVVLLESPGPFCFLSETSPFGAAKAPERLRKLNGCLIRDVALHGDDRVLRIDATTRDEREPVRLLIRLYGAVGGATLLDGEEVVETVGAEGPIEPAPAGGEHAPDFKTGANITPFFLHVPTRAGAATVHADRRAPEATRVLGPYTSAIAACRDAGTLALEAAHASMLHRVSRPARRKLEGWRKLTTNLEADIAKAGEHEMERRVAETLAAYQTRIPGGADLVKLPDLYNPDQMLTIELDPAEAIHVQIEKRFRRATKLEKSVAHAERRLALVRRESAELDAALALLDRAETFEESLRVFEAMRAKFGIEPEGPRVKSAEAARKKKEVPTRTYRQFDLDARWFALVGRNNRENDEITFEVASPGDYWFHAQGMPGSHVVLRSRGGKDAPPRAVLERAASIAAHFSKGRHSGLVPVIYTLRKYVRKFRGADPGQVRCERETTLMVPPVLPGPVRESD